MVRLPGLVDKGDVTDWLVAGGTPETLEQHVKDTPTFSNGKQVLEQLLTTLTTPKKSKETLTEKILKVIDAQEIKLYHTPDKQSFASIKSNGHIETHLLSSHHFKHWLTGCYWHTTQNAPSSQSINDVLTVLDARAHFEGEERGIHNRVAEHQGSIYLDLCNDAYEIVQISADGWTLLDSHTCPVAFMRSSTSGALPRPDSKGDIQELRAFIHVDDEQWALLAAFLLAALLPAGPYPLLNLTAEQGSGKSTTARILKWLIDPTPKVQQLLRTTPRDEQGLFIGARNNHVLAFDNLSSIRPWFSDALCVLSTGGSFVSRSLYTNNEETTLEAMRPVILTGIGDLATRGDLLSRSLLVNLKPLAKQSFMSESLLWEGLETMRPSILGGILNTAVEGLRDYPTLKHAPETRLADFEMWAVACDPYLKGNMSFMEAYRNNRANAAEVVLSSSPLYYQIQALMERCYGVWQGTARQLLQDLEEYADYRIVRGSDWPKTPQALGNRLDRLAPALRDVGIDMVKQCTNTVVTTQGVDKVGTNGLPLKASTKERRGQRPCFLAVER